MSYFRRSWAPSFLSKLFWLFELRSNFSFFSGSTLLKSLSFFSFSLAFSFFFSLISFISYSSLVTFTWTFFPLLELSKRYFLLNLDFPEGCISSTSCSNSSTFYFWSYLLFFSIYFAKSIKKIFTHFFSLISELLLFSINDFMSSSFLISFVLSSTLVE